MPETAAARAIPNKRASNHVTQFPNASQAKLKRSHFHHFHPVNICSQFGGGKPKKKSHPNRKEIRDS